jgi:predicted phage tail protein
MINIILHGVLGKKLGKNWQLNVDSIYEIFEAVEANNQKINKYFSDFKKFVTHFIVYVDGKILPSHLLKSKILENGNKVEIIPIVQGGGTALIITGIIMMILSIILSIVLSPKVPKDVKTNSSIMGSINNVLNRNAPVPLGYGRLKVGSLVISNDILIMPKFDTAYNSQIYQS